MHSDKNRKRRLPTKMDTSSEQEITDDIWLIGYTCIGAVGSFLVLLVALLGCCTLKSEIEAARRVILWSRLTVGLTALAFLLQLYFDLQRPRRVVWPDFSAARPICGCILSILGMFMNSHPFFRWAVSSSLESCLVAATVSLCPTDISYPTGVYYARGFHFCRLSSED